MYRSQSSSSVFWGPGNQSNQDDRNWKNEASKPPSTMNTITNALGGSKTATTAQLPTNTGNRPLPRALLPKSARTPPSNSALNSPQPTNGSRHGSLSSSLTPKSLTLGPGWRGSTSGSLSSTISGDSSPSGSTEGRTRVAQLGSTPNYSNLAASVDSLPAARTFNRVHPVGGAPVVVRQGRRREPVVQDSIYPLLRAALGKDEDTQNQKTEDDVKKQVAGVRGYKSTYNSLWSTLPRGTSPGITSTCPPDDVFAQSHMTGDSTNRIIHTKSHSDVLPSREAVYDQMETWKNSQGYTAASIPTGRTNQQIIRQPYETTHPCYPAAIPLPTKFSSSSRNESRSPPRSPPPLPSQPPPNFDVPYETAPRNPSTTKNPTSENQWYDPIPAQPRKIIHTPKTLQSPQVFFGHSFSPANYPLLDRVENSILDGDSEFQDTREYTRNTPRNGGPSSREYTRDTSRSHPKQIGSFLPEDRDSDLTCRSVRPPMGFRDESLERLTSPIESIQSINHQATDSFNTEDSGLDRWDKDHSADELEASPTHGSSVVVERSPRNKRQSGNWCEDSSEGRGSLNSSPRPHGAEEHWKASTGDDTNSNTSNNAAFINENTVSKTNILNHLLTETSRHAPHNNNRPETTNDDLYTDPICRPPSEFDTRSSVSGGGISSESSNSFSTVTASQGTIRNNTDTDHLTSGISGRKATYGTTWNADDVAEHVRGFGTRDSGPATEERRRIDGMEEWERMTVEVLKGTVGVGFSIEGGKGSLSGDRPIVVKRLFKGGLADTDVDLQPGDELLSIGGQSLTGFSHFDAWKHIKSLPNGMVQLEIRRNRRQTEMPNLLLP